MKTEFNRIIKKKVSSALRIVMVIGACILAAGQATTVLALTNVNSTVPSVLVKEMLDKWSQDVDYKSSSPSSISIPVCSASPEKSYMERQAINTNSRQYELIASEMTVRDDGLLISEDGYIGVALGSYFGELGSKYIFTLENGTELNLIKVEAKADVDTYNGCEHKTDSSVIEFVIDGMTAKEYWGIAPNGYINGGNFNNVEQFKGQIISIDKIID